MSYMFLPSCYRYRCRRLARRTAAHCKIRSLWEKELKGGGWGVGKGGRGVDAGH
jgi:hypothetical protein